MNSGLLRRALRETAPLTLLFGAALVVVETVLSIALPALERSFAASLMALPFFQGVVQALLGVDASAGGTSGAFASIAWVHPVVLALVWAHGIALCTRVPAGEVDRGTIDVLLGLPIGRWQLWCHEGVVWVVAAMVVAASAGAGSLAGIMGGGSRIPVVRLWLLVANLFMVGAVVGGFAALASALSDRRGRAIGAAFIAVLATFLLNYLGQFWNLAARFTFLTPLHYYRPLGILRDGRIPSGDSATLLCAAAAFWLLGGILFARRDLAAS